MTPPSTPLSQDPAPVVLHSPPGGCSCPTGTQFGECSCRWGEMVREILHAGYELSAASAKDELPALMAMVIETIASRRREIFQALADRHRGTVKEFLDTHRLTRTRYDQIGIRVTPS